MGSGIALTAAQAGIAAFQVDLSAAQLEKAKAYHLKTLARAVEKGKMQQADADAAGKRISYVATMSEAKSADWAVEAATGDQEEDLQGDGCHLPSARGVGHQHLEHQHHGSGECCWRGRAPRDRHALL